ncbi:MAG: hypothetical protein GX285_02315 [Clostridiales bacterium]|nr:hypothetical protein [Clostridiales bacterium]
MKVNWAEFAKQQLKKDYEGFNKDCFCIGMIEAISKFDHYTDKEILEAIKDVLKSYNEIVDELLEVKD